MYSALILVQIRFGDINDNFELGISLNTAL